MARLFSFPARRAGAPARGAFALACIAMACVAHSARAQAPDTTFDRGTMDVRVGLALNASMPVFLNARGALLLPVERVLNLTGLTAMPGSTDSVRLVPMLGSTVPAMLDVRKRIVQRRDLRLPIAADELVLSGGEWYLAGERMAELLGARVTIDMSALQATIVRQPPFPAELQRATSDPGAKYNGYRSEADGAERAPFLRRTGGVSADWTLSAAGSGSNQDLAFRSQVGVALAGGSLSAAAGVSKAGFDREGLASSWQYNWFTPNNGFVRTVQVGNSGTATSGRAMRGVSFTNTRPYKNGLFSVVGIVPEAPPGWSYEVYRAGRLLGFSNATQRVPVQVPMDYGSTPIELRFIGPAGEEIRTTYNYQVPPQQIGPGRLEYSAGAGLCVQDSNCRVAFVDAATGVRSWLTVSGGAEVIDSTRRGIDPVARALFNLPAGWTGRMEWTRPAASAGFTYFGSGRFNGGLNAGFLGQSSPVASFANAAGKRVFIEPTLSVGLLSSSGVATKTIRLAARVEHSASDASSDRTHLGAALDMSRGRLSADYDKDIALPKGQLTVGGYTMTPRSLPRLVRGIPLNVSAGIQAGGFQTADIGTTLISDERRSLNTQLRWARGLTTGMSVMVNYTATMGGLRQTVTLNAAPNNSRTANVLVGGLAAYDPRFGLTRLARAGINAAGLGGVVYYDNDADGVFGAGDQPAPGVVVRAEGFSGVSDAQGKYAIWGVTAFEPVRVGIDTLQVQDRGFTASDAERSVRLTPNVYTRFNLALSRTREVSGMVEADSTVSTAAGVTVELRDLRRGTVSTVVTFADGGYYLGRVQPGRYQVTIAANSLIALTAAQADAVMIEVSSVGDAVVQAPVLRMIRKP